MLVYLSSFVIALSSPCLLVISVDMLPLFSSMMYRLNQCHDHCCQPAIVTCGDSMTNCFSTPLVQTIFIGLV